MLMACLVVACICTTSPDSTRAVQVLRWHYRIELRASSAPRTELLPCDRSLEYSGPLACNSLSHGLDVAICYSKYNLLSLLLQFLLQVTMAGPITGQKRSSSVLADPLHRTLQYREEGLDRKSLDVIGTLVEQT